MFAPAEKKKLVYVYFLGWQDCGSFGPPIPLFNVVSTDQANGTTLVDKTLREMGLPIPNFPPFDVWNKQRNYLMDGVDSMITLKNYLTIFKLDSSNVI